MTGYWAALAVALVVLVTIVELLRRRRLREKYAVLWLAVAGGIVVLSVFPDLLTWLADALGVQVPINLLFLMSCAVLLIVSLQLSGEISQLEEETRTIAEELAILRLDMERALGQVGGAGDRADTHGEGAPLEEGGEAGPLRA